MFSRAHTLINDAEIAVENATEEQMTAWVAELLPPGAPLPGGALGLHYDVFDASDAYQQWDKVSAELRIEEGNPFLREFDIRPYAVTFILSSVTDRWLRAAIPFVAESTARWLSSKTGRRTLLTFNGGDIPYRLYQGDRVLEDFARVYEPILGKRMAPEPAR